MRQDKLLFDGPNPFDNFTRCSEMTVLLDHERIVLVGSLIGANLMMSFSSIVRTTDDDNSNLTAYTIPLSLILPLFRLDSKGVNNQLIFETSSDAVRIIYNGIEVVTNIYSPNGLTLSQVNKISTANAVQVDPAPYIRLVDTFGLAKDNYLNFAKGKMFITDSNKTLLVEHESPIGKDFAIPVSFIKLLKAYEATTLHIGGMLIGEGKKGVLLISDLNKVKQVGVMEDYEFARRVKSEDIYKLAINKYLNHINLAVQSKDLSAKLDLNNRKLTLDSVSGEKVTINLTADEVTKEGEVDFASLMFAKESKPLLIHDARLLKTISNFSVVRVKICPGFLIATLGKTYRLMFTLRKE